ncbi:MAG: PEP/pyruvate-binding domain-containing protein [Bacteroidia bacterium]
MYFISQRNTEHTTGGKAGNLFVLKEAGLNIPKFVVIPAEVLLSLIEGKKSEDLSSAITNFQIPEKFIAELADHFSNVTYFAVRSSAVGEDGTAHSFAGQFESYLYVSKDQLEDKIKKVWRSAFSGRVAAYREANKLEDQKGIAVIVQEMVEADVAGVAFGINPVTGNRKEKVISAVFGLGEGLVSGELNADTFTVKENGTIDQQLAVKTHQLVFNTALQSGTLKVPVPAHYNASALSNQQVTELSALLHQLYLGYGTYQDIEFAYKDQQLFLLQARPVTTLDKLSDAGGEHIIWDNSNIIESYPGVTTPLTFSFILKVYEAVYIQFVGMMGVSKNDVEENKEVFANMLGLINGRVYYNLLSWYKALALLPGYSINAGFMEKMMGVKERFELKKAKARSRSMEKLRVLNMVRVMLKNLRGLPKMRRDFVRDFNITMERYSKIDFNTKSADELMYLYLDFEQTLLKKWKAPLVNDFFAMIYFGILQKLVLKYKIDETGNVHNNLMCGARDIISTEPIQRCLRIATLIQENPGTKKIFLDSEVEEILAEMEHGNLNPGIKAEIDSYIEKFGDRCVGELKLETITYKQNPAAFTRIIKSYVEQGITSANSHSDMDTRMRREAESKVKKALAGKPFKKVLFNYFLKRSRILVSSRENLRYERTRAFGMVRELFCAIGNKFYAEGITTRPRDIFYLTKEEIFDHIKGTSVNIKPAELIDLRKNQFSAFESMNTSERIDTRGIVYAGNNFNQQRKEANLQADLKGLGCCPGRVKAKVQVVRNPDEVKNLNGDILVTSSTDPGWVTLFPTASGILVERGSLLSHSAIVSREMGKPCIVGITGLLDRLATGDEVEMDGSTGQIVILNSVAHQ